MLLLHFTATIWGLFSGSAQSANKQCTLELCTKESGGRGGEREREREREREGGSGGGGLCACVYVRVCAFVSVCVCVIMQLLAAPGHVAVENDLAN